MIDEPDNSHVMPMLALHLGGLRMAVMSAAGLYYTVFKGMRVLDRSAGGRWSLFESLFLEVGFGDRHFSCMVGAEAAELNLTVGTGV